MPHDLVAVQNVLKKTAPGLLGRANVVAAGAGYKVSRGKRTADLAVVCSVTKKVGTADLVQQPRSGEQ